MANEYGWKSLNSQGQDSIYKEMNKVISGSGSSSGNSTDNTTDILAALVSASIASAQKAERAKQAAALANDTTRPGSLNNTEGIIITGTTDKDTLNNYAKNVTISPAWGMTLFTTVQPAQVF